ncbi:hypothetical protein Hanom_Chr09g00860931 [Helianthus anomalus]
MCINNQKYSTKPLLKPTFKSLPEWKYKLQATVILSFRYFHFCNIQSAQNNTLILKDTF